MERIYELMYIVDPRASDEEVVALTDDYKSMAAAAGGTLIKEENWGRRRLAYPIDKVTEGRYVLLYVSAEDKNPLLEVELRMRQNEQILRYQTVRSDRMPDSSPPASETSSVVVPMVEEEV